MQNSIEFSSFHYEFVSDVNLNEETALSKNEKALADRVRRLQNENKEMQKAIEIYQEALQLCQENLNNVVSQQDKLLSDTQKNYNQAKAKVDSLNQKIKTLETQLEEKIMECMKNKEIKRKIYDEKPSISADDHQSLTAECLELEKLIKSLPQNDSVPQTIYNQLITQAQSMKEKLGQLNVRHVELECQNNEFKNSNQRSDENMNLNPKPSKNNNDKIKVELLSHECQTTDEAILADQLLQDQCAKISKLESEIQELKKLMDRRETMFLTQKEDILTNKAALEEQIRKMKETSSIQANKSFDDAIAAKKDLEQQLREKTMELTKVENDKQNISSMHEKLSEKFGKEIENRERVENELKAQVVTFCQDIQVKETECEDMKKRLEISENEFIRLEAQYEELRKTSENRNIQNERKVAGDLAESKSQVDNLTAQLMTAEEMIEHKDADLQKLQKENQSLVGELETVPLLKQQLEVFQTDFNQEQELRQKTEERNRKLVDEIKELQLDVERLTEEMNDPTGSRMAEMQRRHGCGNTNQAENGVSAASWSLFHDRYLSPRGGPPTAGLNNANSDNDINRQVSGGRCPKCDQIFPDLDTLQTHVVQCLESESSKVCPKCNRAFPDLDTLQIHVMECLDN